MEDNGLEPQHDSPCLSNIDESAARFPARFDENTIELLTLWAAMNDTAKADLLGIARGLARSVAGRSRSSVGGHQR